MATDPAHRAKCLAVARARLADGMTASEVAGLIGASERSVRYWTALALIYPEGRHLRDLKSAS